MDCRCCEKWDTCLCGKPGHDNGTASGYSSGECQQFTDMCVSCIHGVGAPVECGIAEYACLTLDNYGRCTQFTRRDVNGAERFSRKA